MRYLLNFIIGIGLLTLYACGGGSDAVLDPIKDITGNITVSISGLPNGTSGALLLVGPDSFNQVITVSTTVSDLTTGAYVLTAVDVISGQKIYSPDQLTQTITLLPTETESLDVVYSLQVLTQQHTFPIGLALASPTDIVIDKGISLEISALSVVSPTWTTAYASAVTQIDQLLSGDIAVNDAFTPDLFFSSGTNASCYGPRLKYQDHPDGALPNSGELPGGDLMIWLATDVATGNTCAAAELNGRLNGIKDQSFAALMSLASMLYVAQSNGDSLPEVGASLDLTVDMNALGLSGVTFTVASISQTSTDQWDYTQTYSFNDGIADRDISVTMSHTSSDSEVIYSGIMAYSVSGDNTIFMGGNCGESERTLNGSLAYDRTSVSELSVQSRIAILCGANSQGFINDPLDTAVGQVDPANRYDVSSNPDGWSENFNLFGMQMNPENLEGSYAYAWQAGVGDSHSRTFLMGVNFHETGGTGPIDGEAYAGFGATVDTTEGEIDGMICNWAGPNNSHTLQDFAQRQFFSLDTATGTFVTPTGGENITYAPTNNCSYDGTGSYLYDTNLDGDLADESVSPAITTDLMSAVDLDLDGIATMPEAITNRGYVLPVIPGGFPGNL
jgi:hypothetical protein